MEAYEFEGKTAEEAIEKASRELNLPVDELDIDIIEPGSAGIFGLVGTKKTKVRVNVKSEEKNDDIVDLESPTESLKTPEEDQETSTEGLETAKEALEKILSLIPVETTVNANRLDGKIALDIEGDTSGLLIGRKGKTLDALQYIVNKIANKTSDKKVRVVIDSENYRQRRIESLNELALKIGNKVKKIKKPLTTNPLNPHDRRIVHLALKDDEKLDTRSRGEGLLKKVVIIPKK